MYVSVFYFLFGLFQKLPVSRIMEQVIVFQQIVIGFFRHYDNILIVFSGNNQSFTIIYRKIHFFFHVISELCIIQRNHI